MALSASPHQAGGPAEDSDTSPLATHISTLLGVSCQAAGGCPGGSNIGSLGTGAEVQLHSLPGSLYPLPPVPLDFVFTPSPLWSLDPNRTGMASMLRSQGSTLTTFQARS